MHNIAIRRPREKDIEELCQLFKITITDNFLKEGLGDDIEGLKEEVEEKKRLIEEDIKVCGKNYFFLIAWHDEKIVGTISYGPSNNIICDASKGKLKDIGEIGSLYVLPEYQKRGIGTLLLNSIFTYLIGKDIKEFCLDSGYTIAKKIWTKKFGNPMIILKDYWGEGFDHYIWHCQLEDMIISYKIF